MELKKGAEREPGARFPIFNAGGAPNLEPKPFRFLRDQTGTKWDDSGCSLMHECNNMLPIYLKFLLLFSRFGRV